MPEPAALSVIDTPTGKSTEITTATRRVVASSSDGTRMTDARTRLQITDNRASGFRPMSGVGVGVLLIGG